MYRRRIDRTCVVIASIAALFVGGTLHGQEPRTSITVGLALSTEYPDRFQKGCDNALAAAPSVRAHHRIHRFVTAELGISGLFKVPPGNFSSCGDVVPLVDGDLTRSFDTRRSDVSVAGEARIVVTPVTVAGGSLRLLGGGAWYPVQRSPAWILGAGYRPLGSWRTLFFDVEHWSVGVSYDLERYRDGAPREFLREGREWQGFWQVRVGFMVLSM